MRRYLVANLASLLPVAAALLVVVVARQTMYVAHGDCPPAKPPAEVQTAAAPCPDANGAPAGCKAAKPPAELRTNPVLCADTGLMRRLFDNALIATQLIAADKPPSAGEKEPQSGGNDATAKKKATALNLRGQRAELKKEVDDAAAEQNEAEKEKKQASEEDKAKLLKDALAVAQAASKDAGTNLEKLKKAVQSHAADPPKPAPPARHGGAPGKGAGRSRPTPPSAPTDADLAKAETSKASADAATVAAMKNQADAAKESAQAEKSRAEAVNKGEAARQKLASFDRTVDSAIGASLLREARARLLWFGSFGSSLAVALGTIFAMVWVVAAAIDDHWRPMGVWLPPARCWRLALIIFMLLIELAALWFGMQSLIAGVLFGKFENPSLLPFDGLVTFDDNLQSYIFGSDNTTTPAALLKEGLSLLKTGNWVVIAAGIAIAAAVTATLYQQPEQVKARRAGPSAEKLLAALHDLEKVATAAPPAVKRLEALLQHLEKVAAPASVKRLKALLQRLKTLAKSALTKVARILQVLRGSPQEVAAAALAADDLYIQFLARCFRRLSVAIYFGAVLLVVSVGRISAQYSWPAALLDPDLGDPTIKPHLADALKNVADQFAVEYGMIFTLLLFSLFLPAWFVLRRRAWETARARKPGTTQDCQQKWLSSQGLAFTYPQHAAQLVALLAPAGAGIFLDALKSFTGG